MKAWHYRLTHSSGQTHDMYLHGCDLDRLVGELLSSGMPADQVYIEVVLDDEMECQRKKT